MCGLYALGSTFDFPTFGDDIVEKGGICLWRTRTGKKLTFN